MMKIKTAVLTSISALMCGLISLSACSQINYSWSLGELDPIIDSHTTAQTEFLQGENYKKSSADGKQELSRPEPVHFTWSAVPDAQSKVTVETYVLEISEWHNFYESIKYETADTELDVYNLLLNAGYFWRVTAKLSNGKQSVSPSSAFQTADAAPRNIYVDGITNVRDLGGWKTADGGHVKQGMIYRCGRLNESETPAVNIEITQKGIDTMRNILGVRTEIDLRMPDAHNVENGGITSSPLGEDVNYYNVPMDWVMSGSYNYLTDPQYFEAIRQIFAYLADEDNYPVIYHCNIGTDRTGLFAFLINGLLGVSEDDLYRDYLFSNFGNICYKPTDSPRTYASLTASGGYVDAVKKYTGTTLSEKIENYLTEKIEVPREHLDALREILAD